MHTTKQPFDYTNKQDFQNKLVEWVGDVLYDIIPESGYEVRDEQIFTAFQIADAMCEKRVHFAEAGLGTGKTFAYLLAAIPYARMSGRPVVIACATTALQEQLASKSGDIATLSQLLGLDVDVRMAKDPNEYICDVRAHENAERLGERAEEIMQWLGETKLGQRSEMPTLTDVEWKQIKWDETMACDRCTNRGYCKLVKAREAYRETKDLLIVDHETFFYDLWTRETREAMGQTPVLPHYAAVVFDEGHKVLLPAVMKAGRQINKEELELMIAEISDLQGARDTLLLITETLEDVAGDFFEALQLATHKGERDTRRGVTRTPQLIKAATQLMGLLDQILVELQIEQELYTESLEMHQIQAYEGQIEKAVWALRHFLKDEGAGVIAWVQTVAEQFWVVPRFIDQMLAKHLFNKKIPTIFTSATLSNQGDFTYLARTLGVKTPSHSTIGSPFDMAEQVVVSIQEETDKVAQLIQLLESNGGHTLVLAHTIEQVTALRKALSKHTFPFNIRFEDEGDRGYLVRQFKEDIPSVLVGAHFWEGIDVPGEALTQVIIWALPLENTDPILEAQRKEAQEKGFDPKEAVDYPQMALELKQGCGRLIRKEDDHGRIVLLDKVYDMPWESYVLGALPQDAPISRA